jgi:hypothetical protein
VTQKRAATVMAEARIARAEKLDQERVVLLAAAQREMDEAAQRVYALEGELVAACRSQDVLEEKLPSLANQAAIVDW